MDKEIKVAVKTLGNGRTDGGTMMRVEDVKDWLGQAEAEEEIEKEGADGLEREGDTWCLLVRLIRNI